MTTINLATDDPAAASAALYDALEHYGPPVTLKCPGKPDLTVNIPADELRERMVNLLVGLMRIRDRA